MMGKYIFALFRKMINKTGAIKKKAMVCNRWLIDFIFDVLKVENYGIWAFNSIV